MKEKTSKLILNTADESLAACCQENCPHIKSLLLAPILQGVDHKPKGLIVLESSERALFGADDRGILDKLAAYAVIAIQGANRYNEIQANARLLGGLLEASHSITTLQEPQVVLSSVVEKARVFLACDLVTLYTFAENEEEIEFPPVVSGVFYQSDALGKLGYVTKSSVVWKVLQARQPHFQMDSLSDPMMRSDNPLGKDGYLPFVEREKVVSSAAIPLLVGKERVGVLFVNYRTAHSYTEQEKSAILLFANQVSIAIKNARLYRTEQQRVDHLDAIHSVSKAANSTLDLTELYRKALAEMVKVFDMDQGGVVVIDPKNGVGTTVAEYPKNKEPRIPIPLKGNAVMEWILANQTSLVIEDVLSDTRLNSIRDAVNQWGAKSMLLIPLVVNNEVIGTIGLDAIEAKRKFSKGELDLAQTMADRVASAVHNARSYNSILKQEKQLRALYEAAKVITESAGLDRHELLDKILKLAIDVTSAVGGKATLGTIQIIDEQTGEREFTNVYPQNEYSKLRAEIGHRLPLDKAKIKDGKIGITGRAAVNRGPILVTDVRNNPDYIEYSKDTKSELAVPLLDGDHVLAVINVESDTLAAFDFEDQDALVALADLTKAALKNQEHILQLGRVNAIAMMGAWEADIVHEINSEVGAIHLAITSLLSRSDISEEVKQRLNEIERYAGRLGIPVLPQESPSPGEVVEFHDAPLLDDVIKGAVKDFEEENTTEVISVSVECETNCPSIRVAMHPSWVTRLTYHLLWNAMRAVLFTQKPGRIVVRTCLREDTKAVVEVEDTGGGVSSEDEDKLFVKPIRHEDGSEGRGLLLVGYLAEIYGGSAYLVHNRKGQGACFAFCMPIASPSNE
jgi:GAF domain-containing protein